MDARSDSADKKRCRGCGFPRDPSSGDSCEWCWDELPPISESLWRAQHDMPQLREAERHLLEPYLKKGAK